MDEATYKAWLPLHERASRKEVLTSEEQAVYEAGCAEMDAGETFAATLSELRAARERADLLEAKHTAALERYRALQAEIAALESQFSEPTRRALGIGSHP